MEEAMKVKDLIIKLQKFDPELPVCIYDWAEEYSPPSEQAAEKVELIQNVRYWPTGAKFSEVNIGTFVCIGE